jgi:hypothetical protein
MSTFPTTPPPPVGRPCYTCVHLYDVAAMGHATCARERAAGRMSVQSTPENGCVYWRRDTTRPEIATRAEWVALHGPMLAGFTERGERHFRPAMTAADARRAARDRDAQALAWEVARLHDVLRRIMDALYCMQMRIELEQFRQDIGLLRQLLAAEPAVAAHLRRQAAERARWRH